METARTSLNIKQRHRRPRSSGAAWLRGQAGPGWSPEPWQQRTVGCWPRKTAETKGWPSPLPSIICSKHHHTPSPTHSSVPIRSRPLTSDECSYPCTALMVPPAHPHCSHTRTHTVPLVHVHVDCSTHTFTQMHHLAAHGHNSGAPLRQRLQCHTRPLTTYTPSTFTGTHGGVQEYAHPMKYVVFYRQPYMCKYVSEHEPATSLPPSVSLQ